MAPPPTNNGRRRANKQERTTIPESFTVSALLLPELTAELANTRKMIAALPEDHANFKPREKSSSLAARAGHMVGLLNTIRVTLAEAGYDFALNPNKRLSFVNRAQLLAEFELRAQQAFAALKATSDEALNQTWILAYSGKTLFSGPRFTAKRLWA